MDVSELTGKMPAELLNKLFAPLQVVPMLSPSSSAPSSASSASPPLVGGKRASSPVETQSKKARLSPEGQMIMKSEMKKEIKQETEDSNESLSDLTHFTPGAPVAEETIFCQVPGRLAILNANTKYPVTVGEIKRRLGNPERLNTSVMGGILRRAKAKNGGKELRELLEGMGLDLPMGKRKAISMTLFTPMVEGEALHLAKDFDILCNTEFPIDTIAEQLVGQNFGNKEKKAKFETTSLMLNELKNILLNDRSPLMDSKEEIVLPKEVQDALTHFSMCTHGFGVPALLAALNVIIKVIDTSVNKLSETEHQVNWNTFYALATIIQQQAAQQQSNAASNP